MATVIRSVLIAMAAVVLASILMGIGSTIWYHNGISERTVPASIDAFLFFLTFSTPPALVIGLPLATKLPARLFPFAGLVVGFAWGLFLTWLDDFFTGPGIEMKWALVAALHGLVVGVAAFVISGLVARRSAAA